MRVNPFLDFLGLLVTVLSENDPTLDSPFTSLATLKKGTSFGVSIEQEIQKDFQKLRIAIYEVFVLHKPQYF